MAKEAGYTAKGYWASNTVYVKSASPAFVRKMMKVADVRKINGNKAYSIIDNVDGETQEDKFTIVNNTHETTKRRSAPPRSPCGAPPADPLARSIAQYHTRGGRGVAQRLRRGSRRQAAGRAGIRHHNHQRRAGPGQRLHRRRRRHRQRRHRRPMDPRCRPAPGHGVSDDMHALDRNPFALA